MKTWVLCSIYFLTLLYRTIGLSSLKPQQQGPELLCDLAHVNLRLNGNVLTSSRLFWTGVPDRRTRRVHFSLPSACRHESHVSAVLTVRLKQNNDAACLPVSSLTLFVSVLQQTDMNQAPPN